MIVNRLLSIKRDNIIMLYNISFKKEQLCEFLTYLNNRYTKTKTDIIDTSFVGIRPLSYGKYDSMKDICTVKELEIYEQKKDENSNSYNYLNETAKEWEFLTEEEKLFFTPLEGIRRGKLKLEVVYPSVIAKTIKEALNLEQPNKCIIDATNLIKLINKLNYITNDFIYDKTIDLSSKKKRWNDPGIAFLSKRDYINYIKKSYKNINKDLVITDEELEKFDRDYDEISFLFQNMLEIKQIGIFPLDLDLNYELEILKRFGIRNEHFEWFDRKLEMSNIDYDGGAIINEMRNTILQNYDLHGVKTEINILDKIEQNKANIKRIMEENNNLDAKLDNLIYKNKSLHELTKKIKAA